MGSVCRELSQARRPRKPTTTASAMSLRSKARALLRTESSLVNVCLRTGSIRSQAPALSYAADTLRAKNAASPAASKDPSQLKFSMSDSLAYIEGALAEGELRATSAIKRGVLKMRAEVERMEEALLLEEADLSVSPHF